MLLGFTKLVVVGLDSKAIEPFDLTALPVIYLSVRHFRISSYLNALQEEHSLVTTILAILWTENTDCFSCSMLSVFFFDRANYIDQENEENETIDGSTVVGGATVMCAPIATQNLPGSATEDEKLLTLSRNMRSRMASLKEAAVWSFVPNRWYSCEQDSADVVSTQLAATIKCE